MAKAATKPVEAPPQKRKATVAVTYRPFDDEKPVVKWNGITFRANIPVELDPDNADHQVAQLVPQTFPGTNGETLTKHVEGRISMIELAKRNPQFEVEGFPRARKKINTRTVPPPGAEWTEAHEGQISNSEELDRSVAA